MEEIKKVIILIFASAIIGLLIAFVQGTPLITPPPQAIDKKLEMMKEKVPLGVTIINYDELNSIVETGSKKIIDARSAEKYHAGHIEGAVNIPSATALESSDAFMNQFGPETPVVIYCDGPDCMASIIVAEVFKGYSYEDVSIYLEGYDTWLTKRP